MILEKQKTEIQQWIDENYDKLCSIRIRIGNSTKAETVSILTINQEYNETKSDHAPTHINKEDFSFHVFSVIDQNGYGSHETYLRLYAYNDKNKQFSTIQKTTKIKDTDQTIYSEGSMVESISRVVQPLAQALLKSNQQLINSHEILTNANSHYQDTSLRMMEAMIETKEEGIDYINLAMQMKVLLDNNQPQEQQSDYSEEMGEKLLNAFGGLMGGMGTTPPPKAPETTKNTDTTYRTPPNKEEMKYWAKNPMFVMDVADVFNEMQKPTDDPKEDDV